MNLDTLELPSEPAALLSLAREVDDEFVRRSLLKSTPAAFRPLLKPTRYKGLYGGRGTGKSHFFAELVLHYCRQSCQRIVCVREIQKSLDKSAKLLLEDKIEDYRLGDEFEITRTHINAPHGGTIIFQGMQDHTKESIKSLEAFNIAWVEEAQSLSMSSLKMLTPTIREPGSEMWFSWNPDQKTNPVDDFFRGNAPRKPGEPPWSPDPRAVAIGSTYRDNPLFPDVLRKDMERDQARDPEGYAHVWLGEYQRKSEARVFKNWTVRAFETPANAVLYYGADWGYSIDPTVLVRCWVDGKTLYIDQEVYRVGCDIDATPALFDAVDGARDWPIRADSARPETIAYLQKHGYPKIEAATKGANSLKEGVIFLQGYDIIIHPRCVHTIDEFTMYSHVVDKLTGIVTPLLEDKKNHVVDAVRYATELLRVPVVNNWVVYDPRS